MFVSDAIEVALLLLPLNTLSSAIIVAVVLLGC